MVNTLFNSLKKNHNKKSLEGRFQRKQQTAVSGTEHTVTFDTGKVIHRKFISEPIIFQRDRKTAPKIGDTNTPKNRHCLRGVDGKYIQWNEILRDVLNGKLKIVQNQRTESDSERAKSRMKKVTLKITTPQKRTANTNPSQHLQKIN